MASLTIDGTDLRKWGVVVRSKPGARSAPQRRVTVSSILGSMGGVATSVLTDSRGVEIVGALVRDTYALRRTLETNLKDLTAGGLRRIVWDDGVVAQRIDGIVESVDIDPFAPEDRSRAARVRIGVRCLDPTWRSVEPSILSLPAATRVPIPLGTAPSRWIMRAMASNPVFTYRSAGGTPLWTLTITKTLTSTEDYITLDATTGLLSWSDNGTVATDWAMLAEQQDFLKGLDPQDGHYATSQWPTMTCSVAAELLYWKRWL